MASWSANPVKMGETVFGTNFVLDSKEKYQLLDLNNVSRSTYQHTITDQNLHS
jgi:hypothetical protein